MPTYKTIGLVLRRHNLGEADRIISFLTPDRGKLRAVARGVRKIKSRQAGHLELFCESQIMLAQGRNLDIVTSARLQRFWPALAESYPLTATSYLIAELIDKLIDEEVGSPELYRMTTEAYQALADGVQPATVEAYFKLRLLDVLGYRPELNHCVGCGQATSLSRTYFLESALGGIVDETCRQDGSPISPEQIKLWRLALAKPIAVLVQADREGELMSASLDLLDRFYGYTFGKTFRSKQIFNETTDERET